MSRGVRIYHNDSPRPIRFSFDAVKGTAIVRWLLAVTAVRRLVRAIGTEEGAMCIHFG